MSIMKARGILWFLGLCLVLEANAASKPNLIFILADDLGYGDLGCFGQKLIKTPRLDRMAAEGLKFTQFYAGCTVCAPSRSVLMTGQHMGHTWVRGNATAKNLEVQTLRSEDRTVAELLKAEGYRTALIGKWGLGEPGSPGHPLKKGFDHFFGYLNQGHAHNYYPAFLWRNEQMVPLKNGVVPVGDQIYGAPGAGYATNKVEYSHDLIVDEGLRWLRENKDTSFFLYFALTMPHANNEATRALKNGQEVPEHGEYAAMGWPDPEKGQAAMITRMDRDVGRVLDLLAELGIAEKTLVMFTSDNGPHKEGGQDPEFFDPNGPFRGMKRDLYDGGIRVPTIAWRPGTIKAGTVSDHIGYFADVMATVAEMAGCAVPAGTDGISFLPVLEGKPERQRRHEYLYWEFYEGKGGAQAVRMGNWKGVRKPAISGKIELYDIEKDPGESSDVADGHPDIIEKIRKAMEEAHAPSPNWAFGGRR